MQAPTSRTESFTSAGLQCAADVWLPAGEGPAPAIVMAHGFGSPRKLRLPAYAERLAAAGYVVVVFDYRYFGDSDGEPRQLLDIKAQLDDWRAALRFARGLERVDAARIVAWGTSFAGGHVLTIAASGEPLAAVIAQVPHVSGPAAVRSTGLRQAARLLPTAVLDRLGALVGRPPRYLESVGAQGERAVMTSPDAAPALERLTAASGLAEGDYPQTVVARVLTTLPFYSPGRRAGAITCPVLFQLATDDAITPTGVAQRAARRIPHATIRSYQGGHFDPYVPPLFEPVIADQLAFLAEAVPVTA